jgi:hypothetical protein
MAIIALVFILILLSLVVGDMPLHGRMLN